MILARLLAADGHHVGSCCWCGRVFARDLDHNGHPHNFPRSYCSKRCRSIAKWQRRAPRVRHARHWAAITELHQLERAGQDPLPGHDPLPQVPAYEEVPS